MARATYYETLGLRPGASEKEIRTAYRRLALRHHPDRNPDPASTRLFMAATEAFEILTDPQERRRYDEGLQAESRRAVEREAETRRQKDADARVRAARAASTAPQAPDVPRSAPGTPLPTQLTRLSLLFSRGLYAEAEKLADEIVVRDPRQPLPYAIKGDLARQRGKLDEAARQYSLAIQMDPRNPTYLKRYEEVLERARTTVDDRGAARMEPSERLTLASMALAIVVLLAAAFVAISPERSVVFGLTVGLIAMLFLCGVAVGSCLSAGGGLDRIDAYAAGRLGPTVALGLVSVVSFPVAAVLYVVLGLVQRGFSTTTTRLILGVAAAVVTLALATILAHNGVAASTVLLWGGNLAYLGALVGWALADGLRR